MNPTSSSTSSRAVGSSNTSSNNWRNPSESQREKYNLREWPADDVLTLEEEQLLEMYEVIRQHERVAARLKEEAARAKLAAADAEFHQKQQRLASNDQKKHKRRKRVKQKLADNEGNTDSDDNDDDDDLDDDVNDSAKQDDDDDDVVYSDDEDNLHARREAKLSQLRMEVAQAQQQQAGDSTFLDQKQENDKMRSHYPAVTEAVDDGPLLKRKLRRDILDPDFSTTEPSSLIANMTEAATPPHEFSKKLELIKTGGKVLFPESSGNSNTSSLDVFKWEPPSNAETPNDGAFEAKLNDFDMELAQNGLGNNTVAIKVWISTLVIQPFTSLGIY